MQIAQVGHAPPRYTILARTPRGYRVHTLRLSGFGPAIALVSSHLRVLHDAPFARPLLAWAVLLYRVHPRTIRLVAG